MVRAPQILPTARGCSTHLEKYRAPFKSKCDSDFPGWLNISIMHVTSLCDSVLISCNTARVQATLPPFSIRRSLNMRSQRPATAPAGTIEATSPRPVDSAVIRSFLSNLLHTFSLTSSVHQSKMHRTDSASKSARIKGARIACEFGSTEAGMVVRNLLVSCQRICLHGLRFAGIILHVKTSTIRLWCQQNQDLTVQKVSQTLPSQETLESSMFWCFSWAKVWRPWQLGLGKPRVKQSSRCDVKGFLFDAFWKDVFEINWLDVSGV